MEHFKHKSTNSFCLIKVNTCIGVVYVCINKHPKKDAVVYTIHPEPPLLRRPPTKDANRYSWWASENPAEKPFPDDWIQDYSPLELPRFIRVPIPQNDFYIHIIFDTQYGTGYIENTGIILDSAGLPAKCWDLDS